MSFDLENDLEVKFRGHHLIGLKTFQMFCVMTFVQILSSFGTKYHSEKQMTSRSNFKVTI